MPACGQRAFNQAHMPDGAPAPPLLRVEEVGKRYADGEVARWVLRGVSFTVDAGQVVALWGPSGAGKSTLLNLLGGLAVPDEGRIGFALRGEAGEEETVAVSAASERQRAWYRRRHVGYIFQFFNLVPTLTVAENVLLPIALARRRADNQRALARLDHLGLAHCRERFPQSLSGGEQQRAAIARALAHRPKVLLADEPTGNLDAANAARVTTLLWEQAQRTGCALVVATHNEAVAAKADQVVSLGTASRDHGE